MSGSQAQQTAPASPVIPGFLVQQGLAIQARLQLIFPPSIFHFMVLPPRLDMKTWNSLMQGNQPFLGLGFNGFKPDTGTMRGKIQGKSSWSVLTAVRRNGSDEGRYFGDKFGIGALTMAEVATTALNGFNAATGSVEVVAFSNVAADGWGDDSVIMKIDLAVPATLALQDEILAPDGLGWFDVLASTWGWSAQDGTSASLTSIWNNPNAQPTDS